VLLHAAREADGQTLLLHHIICSESTQKLPLKQASPLQRTHSLTNKQI
jgi:hypothetical protein